MRGDHVTVYRGFNVLEIEPEWSDDRGFVFGRLEDRMDQGYGRVQVNDYAGRNFSKGSLRWWLGSRSDVVALRALLDAQGGRQTPFWVPTWVQDLSLAQAAQATDAGLVVSWRAYGNNVFSDTARRDLAILLPAGNVYRRVTACSQTATTETLTLDSALGVAVPVGTLVSFLVLCRLDTDEPEVRWENPLSASGAWLGSCDLPLAEIPLEVP